MPKSANPYDYYTIRFAQTATMIPAGYMLKKVVRRPDWLKAAYVDDIYSASGCVSQDFTDYIGYWKHNGYWLFNSPTVIEEIVRENNLNITGMTLFYYKIFEEEFDEDLSEWSSFEPDESFMTNVEEPNCFQLKGYDVTTFSAGCYPEHSPLSCNGLASKIIANRHCLFESFERAKQSLEAKEFSGSEPGPFRIFAVYKVRLPVKDLLSDGAESLLSVSRDEPMVKPDQRSLKAARLQQIRPHGTA